MVSSPLLSSLLIALLVAVVLGGAATVYIRRVYRHGIESTAGLRIVAGMRWREFSQLVVDALRERGFEPETQDSPAHRGQQSDLVLSRNDRRWLLACKQGADFRITPGVLAEFSKSMRLNNAAEGVIATPGKVDADARGQAASVEIINGAALWALLKPLLPVSVRNSVAADADTHATRSLLLGWGAALLVGLGVAWLMPAVVDHDRRALTSAAGGTPAAGKSAPANPIVLAPAPLSEDEQREEVRRKVSELPGIDRAVWSTRSTLLIYLADDSGADPLPSICTVMERNDALRASRLQLQPVPGSQRAVRFLQCKVF